MKNETKTWLDYADENLRKLFLFRVRFALRPATRSERHGGRRKLDAGAYLLLIPAAGVSILETKNNIKEGERQRRNEFRESYLFISMKLWSDRCVYILVPEILAFVAGYGIIIS